MITVDKHTQAHWLETGRMPLAGQFVAWLSKFWQKNELIPAASLDAFTLQTLTYAATVAWDASLGHRATLTLTGDASLECIANLQAGGSFTLFVAQDATGSHSLSFDTAYKFPNGTAPALTATANAMDILTFESDDGEALRLVSIVNNSK